MPSSNRPSQEISEYAVDRRLPDGVTSRIKRHFRYFYFKTSVFDERAVLRHVPWQLCQEVVAHTHAAALTATGLLQVRSCFRSRSRSLYTLDADPRDHVLRRSCESLRSLTMDHASLETWAWQESGLGRPQRC